MLELCDVKEKREKKNGIGSHSTPNNGRHELWLTPPQLINQLGSFDLDPCACPDPRPWPTAKHHIALPDDGLSGEWFGRVWLNPPYGDKLSMWLERMSKHRNGIALTFARTETECFRNWVWPYAKALLFISGRLWFYLPSGTRARTNSGAPSVLIAYNDADADHLYSCGIAGAFVSNVVVKK